jgi:hypothetical protein
VLARISACSEQIGRIANPAGRTLRRNAGPTTNHYFIGTSRIPDGPAPTIFMLHMLRHITLCFQGPCHVSVYSAQHERDMAAVGKKAKAAEAGGEPGKRISPPPGQLSLRDLPATNLAEAKAALERLYSPAAKKRAGHQWRIHHARWEAVLRARRSGDGRGRTLAWSKCWAKAAESLVPTQAAGEADTVKRSYALVQAAGGKGATFESFKVMLHKRRLKVG